MSVIIEREVGIKSKGVGFGVPQYEVDMRIHKLRRRLDDIRHGISFASYAETIRERRFYSRTSRIIQMEKAGKHR